MDVVQYANGSPAMWLTLSGKALARRADEVIAALRSSIAAPEFSTAAVAEAIAAQRGEQEKLLVYPWSAPRLALSLAAAGLDDAGALRERMTGVTRLAFLRELDPEEAAFQLTAVAQAVCSRAHGFGSAQGNAVPRLADQLSAWLAAMPEAEPPGPLPTGLVNGYLGSGEARTATAAHAFNDLARQAVSFARPDAAALTVAASVVSSGTAVHRISRERGAYGANAIFDHDHGHVTFTSWYDPQVLATFGSFQTAIRSVSEGQLEPGQVNAAAARLLASHSATLSGDELARRDWDDRMRGIGHDVQRAFSEEPLAATPAGVRNALTTYLGGSRHATIGSADRISKAAAERAGWFSRVLPA